MTVKRKDIIQLTVHEVSIVDNPANLEPWLFLKREDMADMTDPKELEGLEKSAEFLGKLEEKIVAKVKVAMTAQLEEWSAEIQKVVGELAESVTKAASKEEVETKLSANQAVLDKLAQFETGLNELKEKFNKFSVTPAQPSQADDLQYRTEETDPTPEPVTKKSASVWDGLLSKRHVALLEQGANKNR